MLPGEFFEVGRLRVGEPPLGFNVDAPGEQ
jgi:hypothetical protein